MFEETGGQQQTSLPRKDQRQDARLYRPRGGSETPRFLQTPQPALLSDGRTGLWMAVTSERDDLPSQREPTSELPSSDHKSKYSST